MRRGTNGTHVAPPRGNRGSQQIFEQFLMSLTDVADRQARGVGFQHPGIGLICILETSLTGEESYSLRPAPTFCARVFSHRPVTLRRLPIRLPSIVDRDGVPSENLGQDWFDQRGTVARRRNRFVPCNTLVCR